MQMLHLVKMMMVIIAISEVSAANWQGMGNWTAENITFIKSTISTAKATATTQGNSSAVAKLISNALNTAYDPAWNVVVANMGNTFDCVVYGYAYNGHWLWFNNYQDTNISYVIWKDYNCHTWVDIVNLTNGGNIVGEFQNTFFNVFTSVSSFFFDPWLLAYNIVTQMQKLLENIAFSMIVFQGGQMGDYSARICSVSPSTTNGSYYISITMDARDNFMGGILIRTR